MRALASSVSFRKFAIVFSVAATIIYVLCDLTGWTLFTFHPATGRLEWGRTLPRRDEGPVMYWYGWTAATLIGASVLGLLAMLLPDHIMKRIPLALIWALPILTVPLLVYSLMPFWTK
jgi:hypothetical protein